MANRKSRVDGERTRGKILAEAEREFAEKGYDLASVREITRRAGVNMALANRYFGSKEEEAPKKLTTISKSCQFLLFSCEIPL